MARLNAREQREMPAMSPAPRSAIDDDAEHYSWFIGRFVEPNADPRLSYECGI